jgi:serine/threonine protein phosphatase 1
LLAQPWFYAVQGNHENMMVSFFLSYLTHGHLTDLDDMRSTGFLDYGGAWVTEYFQPELNAMSPEFNRGIARVLELPLMLVVGEQENRFHVIHAELIKPTRLLPRERVWLDKDIDGWVAKNDISPEIIERLYWSRTLMMKKDANKFQPGLSPTFCGHTYADRPYQVLSHVCLDTGAFISINYPKEIGDYGLTLFDVQTSCWYSASYQRDYIVSGTLSLHAGNG